MPTQEIRPLPSFADTLARLYDDSAVDVETSSVSDFQKSWTTHSVSGDILRSVAEDASVVWDGDTEKEVAESIDAGKDSKDVTALVNVLKRVATLPQLPFSFEEARATTKRRVIHFLMRCAEPGLSGFLLSNKQVRCLPVIDDSLIDPAFARGLTEAFVDVLDDIRAQSEVTCLTFIEKNLGPIGALGMLSSIVAATGLPACVYREKSWSRASEFVGYTPSETDKTVIIYDLVLTGAGVRNPALMLQSRFGTEVAGAIVLHSFNSDLKEIPLEGGRTLRIYALHSDSSSSEVELGANNHRDVAVAQHTKISFDIQPSKPNRKIAMRSFGRSQSDSPKENQMRLPEEDVNSVVMAMGAERKYRNLSSELELSSAGEFVVIDYWSDKYATGKTENEALKRYKTIGGRCPAYVRRVGEMDYAGTFA